MSPSRLERGDVLFHEGDPGDRLYVIIEGKIKLGRTSSDGRENLLAILGPGEMFGELSLFDPGPRTATATAVTETQVVSTGPRAAQGVPGSTAAPSVASTLLAALARRLRRTNEVLADLVFTDVPGRVAKALLDLADRFGRPVDDGLLVAHDLTQEELAQLVGASRETVNKALADFASRGWLRLEARAVLLMDVERLRAAPADRSDTASARRSEPAAQPARYSSWARIDSRAAGHTARHVGVDAPQHPLHRVVLGGRAVGERLAHLVEPLRAVHAVERDHRRGIRHHRAVPGQDRARPSRRR